MKTLLSFEYTRIQEQPGTEVRVSVGKTARQAGYRKGTVLRHKMYRGLVEMIKSTALIFILLALYRISGLSDLWIQMIGYFSK